MNIKLLFIALFLIYTNISWSQTENQNLKRVWMLVEFQKFKKSEFINLKTQMDLTNLESPSAKMGCNNIGFKIIIKKNKVKFSKVSRTMMYCENMMQIEDAFSKALPEIKTYKIDRHKLTLKNAKGQKMIFVAQDWD